MRKVSDGCWALYKAVVVQFLCVGVNLYYDA